MTSALFCGPATQNYSVSPVTRKGQRERGRERGNAGRGVFDKAGAACYKGDMISEKDKSVILTLAARYGARRVILFGSSADPERDAADIDLAVEGIRPGDFFPFYSELIFGLSKPVDLIDLSIDSRFSRLVRREGVQLYG